LRVKVASVTYFLPTEKGSTARIGGQFLLCRERRKGLAEGGESLKAKMLQVEQ
jgi:hypothetical protein